MTEHEGRRHQGLRETTDEEADERQVAAGPGRLVEGVEGSEEGRHEEVGIILYWNGQNEFGHQLWEFICEGLTLSGCPRHVGRNYVPLLFGVDPIECRLT